MSAATNPQTYAQRVAAAVSAVAQSQPALAQAIVTNALHDAEFLNSKLPLLMSRANNSPTPQLERMDVTRADMNKLLRYSEALKDPLGVVERIASGDMSLEGVEALKTRRRDLYEEIRNEALIVLSQREEPLPFTRRYMLGLAFDLQADKALDGNYSMTIQQTFAGEAQRMEEGGQPPSNTSTQLDALSESTLTPTQKIASGA
jgi:hypothetical protein